MWASHRYFQTLSGVALTPILLVTCTLLIIQQTAISEIYSFVNKSNKMSIRHRKPNDLVVMYLLISNLLFVLLI
jgi:hypothetical protein